MKKNLMNRVLSLMLAAVMAVSLLPAATISAMAGQGGGAGTSGGPIDVGGGVGGWGYANSTMLLTKYSLVRYTVTGDKTIGDRTNAEVVSSVYIGNSDRLSNFAGDSTYWNTAGIAGIEEPLASPPYGRFLSPQADAVQYDPAYWKWSKTVATDYVKHPELKTTFSESNFNSEYITEEGLFSWLTNQPDSNVGPWAALFGQQPKGALEGANYAVAMTVLSAEAAEEGVDITDEAFQAELLKQCYALDFAIDSQTGVTRTVQPDMSNKFMGIFWEKTGTEGIGSATVLLKGLLLYLFYKAVQDNGGTVPEDYTDLSALYDTYSTGSMFASGYRAILSAFFEDSQALYAGTTCFQDEYEYRLLIEPAIVLDCCQPAMSGHYVMTLRQFLTAADEYNATHTDGKRLRNNTAVSRVLGNGLMVGRDEYLGYEQSDSGYKSVTLKTKDGFGIPSPSPLTNTTTATVNGTIQNIGTNAAALWTYMQNGAERQRGYGLGIVSGFGGEPAGGWPVGLMLKKTASGTDTSGLTGTFVIKLWGNMHATQDGHWPAGTNFKLGYSGEITTSRGRTFQFNHVDDDDINSHGEVTITLEPGESVKLFAFKDFDKLSSGTLICDSMGYEITETKVPGVTCTISASDGTEPVTDKPFCGIVTKDSKDVTVTANNRVSGLTISKEVDAASLAKDPHLKDIEWHVEIGGSYLPSGATTNMPLPASDEAYSYEITHADGTKETGTYQVKAGGHVVGVGTDNETKTGIYLKHGESVTLNGYGDGLNSVWLNLFEHSVDGVYDVTKYTTTLNGETCADNTSHGMPKALTEGPFKFVNTLKKSDGTTHVLIDFNLNGQAATESASVSGNNVVMSSVGKDPVDCGDLEIGKTYTFGLAMNGSALYPNRKVNFGTVKNAADGQSYTLTATFKGLSRTAAGPADADLSVASNGAFTYTVPTKGDTLDVLYCLWEFSTDIATHNNGNNNNNNDNPNDPQLPTKQYVTTIYWDKGYEGGGITSNLVGRMDMCYAVKVGHKVITETEDGTEITYHNDIGNYYANTDTGALSGDHDGWHLDNDHSFSLYFLPSAPTLYRDCYSFVGWSRDSALGWGVWKDAEINALRAKLKNDFVSTVTALVDAALADGKADGVSGNTGNTTTLYAIWEPDDIVWSANGGWFDWQHDTPWHGGEGTSEADNVFWFIDNFDDGPLGTMNVCKWRGTIFSRDMIPIIKQIPKREGYTFTGWFCDPQCTIPLVRNEDGILPGQHYWAGWKAEKVIVNYYDTRQGTGFLGSQEFDYDDAFNMLGSLMQTDGWTSDGWRWFYDKDNIAPDAVKLETAPAARTGVCLNAALKFGNGNKTALTYVPSDKSHWYDATNHVFSDTMIQDGTELSDAGYWYMNLYASHDTMRETTYTVQLNWQDYSNNDGARPTEVTVGLVNATNGTLYATRTLTKNDAMPGNSDIWMYTFEGLPTTTSDASTEKINWEFRILSYKDIEATTAIAIEDTGATFGEIPCKTISHGDTATSTMYSYALDFTGHNTAFKPNGNGEAINDGVKWDYNRVGMAYFNHNLITTGDDIKFTIQWDDDGDNDGVRPDAVTLVLYADTVPVENWVGKGGHQSNTGVVSVSPAMCQVSEDGNAWTYIFRDYQKYNGGQFIDYTVRVTNDDGKSQFNQAGYGVSYLTSTNPNVGDDVGCIIHRSVEVADVPVRIIWNDENNRDGQRPSSVTVSLKAYQWNDHTYVWEEEDVESFTIRADDKNNTMTSSEWTYRFGPNKVYNDGVRRLYRLEVTSDLNIQLPEGACPYTWAETVYGNQYPTNNDRNAATMINNRANARNPVTAVTISQKTNTISVTGQIFWNDHQNNDGKRPSSVIMQLYSHTPGTDVVTPVTGQAYRVQLTGEPTADSWYHTFENVPKYVDGQSGVELVYSIKIIEVDGQPLYGTYIVDDNGPQETMTRYEATYLYETPDGMTSAGGTTETDEFTLSDRPYVKLSHTDETQSVDFSIDWHDSNNQDNVRPSSVKVNLWKQVGDKAPVKLYDEPLTFISTDSQSGAAWTKKLTGLPNRENGEKITYILDVDQDEIDRLAGLGYTLTVEGNIIEMYRTTEVSDLEAYITWDDANNNDGYRPENVTATLYKNGAATDVTVDLNETNGWKHVFKNLDIMYINRGEAGTPVVYSVKVNVPEKYTVEYKPESTVLTEFDKDAGNGYVPLNITLAHAGDTKTVPVTVNWNDDSDHDRKRPESITLQLYADGVALEGKTLTLRAEDFTGNQWTGEFADMQTYTNNGTAVYYTVKVADATATNGIYSIMTAGTTVYLAYKPVTSVMYVSFNYSDNNNADGHRPSGLYLQLTANGEPVDEAEYKHTVNLDPKVDGYRIGFGALPVYAGNGQKIAYNVIVSGLGTEMFDGEGYVASYTNDITLSENSGAAVNQVIVKLTRAANTKTVQGNIYWFDVNNMSGHRPDRLEIRLVNSYNSATTLYVLDAAAGMVTEKETGRQVGEVTVNEWTGDSSVWSYSISGLRANYMTAENDPAGIEYRMTVDTTSITPYYPMVQTGTTLNASLTSSDYETYKTQATTELTMDVQWIDNDNAWGYRPNTQGITVELMAGDDVYKTVVLTSANAVANNSGLWTCTFENLPSFRNGAGVAWTVRVKDTDKYTQSTVITESEHAVVKFVQSQGFDFTINWDDSNNDDNRRPESLTLLVKADGAEVGRVEFTGENNQWKSHITDLPVWSESDPDRAIQYTFQWSDESEAALTEKGYLASSTKNGVETKSDAFYWLSAQPFGENTAEAGYDILTGKYQWETTLSYDKEVADYAFDISFSDDGDRDGIRPESLNIELLADGKVIDTHLLTVDKDTASYQLKWEDMEVWNKAQAIGYTIRVSGEAEGYEISYNEAHTRATLTHEPERVFVKGMIFWDDSTEVKSLINAQGEYLRDYEFIGRASVNMTFYADEQAVANMRVSRSVYGTDPERMKDAYTVTYPWMGADKAAGGVHKYRDHGTEIQYTIGVTSSELNALYDQGYSLTYDAEKLQVTVTHDLYNLDGQVYYLRDTSEDFLLKNGEAMVTAYLQVGDEYIAQQSVGTDANGRYRFTNLKQGLYIVRAVYDYNGHAMAGTSGVTLDRRDASANVIVDRDAANDGFRYEYSASGQVFYQTDRHLASTIHTVPEGSIVLLYKITDGQSEPEYLMMTKTDADGRYTFEKLQPADYLVTVVFNFEDGVYTYDNAEAVADGLSFNITGMDAKWPDIIKQVNKSSDVTEKPDAPVTPEEPEKKPVPCIADGYVFESVNGAHTTKPIENVDVHVYTYMDNIEIGHTKTDENGYWNIEGLAVGDYTAMFSKQGQSSRVLVFHITEDDFSIGTKQWVNNDPTQYFDESEETATGIVSGIVLGEDGRPAHTLVELYKVNEDGSESLYDFQHTDDQGKYEFTVTAGFQYQVRIYNVDTTVDVFDNDVGYPDNALTTLEEYQVSGKFVYDNVPQVAEAVFAYRQDGTGNWKMVTGTLSDTDGNYVLHLKDAGNYRVVEYLDEGKFVDKYVTVGYDRALPQVTRVDATHYTISGMESFDSLILRKNDSGMVKGRYDAKGTAYTGYTIANQDAGDYTLTLVQNGVEKTYYVSCPADRACAQTYTVTVSGEVVDEKGNAIIGSEVTLKNSDGEVIGTQMILSDGKYEFAHLPEGQYSVEVKKYFVVKSAEGSLYTKSTAEADSFGNAYADGLPGGQAWVWNINASRVSGRAVDLDGIPVADLTVYFMANDKTVYGAKTDAEGRYEIGLPAGEYEVSYVWMQDGDHGVTGKAGNLTVAFGHEYEHDIQGVSLKQVSLFTYRPEADGSQTPVSNVTLKVMYADGKLAGTWTTDDQGKADVRLMAGEYSVEAEYQDGKTTVKATASLNIGTDAEGELVLPVELLAGYILAGQVVDADGNAVADAIVNYRNGELTGKVYTDDNGRFEIAVSAHETGVYQLFVNGRNLDSGEYKNVTVNGDVDGVILTLAPVTEDKSYIVSGRVVDSHGNPVEDAEVILKVGSDKIVYDKSSTDADGRFRFNVASGTYYLSASYMDESGKVYVTNAETMAHASEEDTDDVLVLLNAYDLTVKVVDGNGNPVENAKVAWRFDGSRTTEGYFDLTDANGETVKALFNSNYELQASTKGRKSEWIDVKLPDDSLVESETGRMVLTIQLGAAGLDHVQSEPEVIVNDDGSMKVYGWIAAPENGVILAVDNILVTLERYGVEETAEGEKTEWVVVGEQYADNNGYYEFPGLTYGNYRVSYEYTFETEASVKPAGFVIEGRLESAAGGLYENAKVKLYVKKTNADGGTVYEDVAQLMTDETGTFRFDVDEKKAVAFTDGNEWYLANSEGVAIAEFDATHLTVGNKQYDIHDLYWLEVEDAADAVIVMAAVEPQATKLEVSTLAADVDSKVWPLTHVDLYNGEQYVGTYIINENGEVQADVDLEADVKYSVRVYVPVGPVGREPFASENIALEYYGINASDTAMADAYISNRKADDSINVPYLSGLYDIVGTVIDDDGKTVEGAIVTLLDRDEKPVVRKGLTNPYITGEDGRYEFLGLEPGVYYVTVNYKGQDDVLVYEVVIGDGEEHTVTDKTVVEEPAAFEVSIRDYTNGDVTISGEAMSDGALWATEDEALVFTVKSANAAAVAIRVNGELTELVGEKVNNGTYQFVVEGLTADDIVELVTVLVGDITLNGETNSEDLALLASYMFHEYEFTVEPDVQYLAGDVTHNGETNSEDLALLAAAMFHEYDLKWNQR